MPICFMPKLLLAHDAGCRAGFIGRAAEGMAVVVAHGSWCTMPLTWSRPLSVRRSSALQYPQHPPISFALKTFCPHALCLPGLAGMLCHLHWTDPANHAFASLLRSGVLDDICRFDLLLQRCLHVGGQTARKEGKWRRVGVRAGRQA